LNGAIHRYVDGAHDKARRNQVRKFNREGRVLRSAQKPGGDITTPAIAVLRDVAHKPVAFAGIRRIDVCLFTDYRVRKKKRKGLLFE
jgi:hypothetical protein